MSPLPTTIDRPPAARGSLEVRLLGLLDFDAALGLQEWIAYELSGRRDGQGVLLLCEHPPLISVGRAGSRTQILASDAELAACEMPVRWVSRSGGAVVHAPGQLAAYLLLPLDRLHLGPAEFRQRFETALLEVCHELRVPAKRLDRGAGLWTRGGQVGHFGSVVKSWVTQQGMWLNVDPSPGFLRMVRSERAVGGRGSDGSFSLAPDDAAPRGRHRGAAIGTVEQRVTSLQDQLQRRVSMHQVRAAALRHIAAAFGYDDVRPHTGHPRLTRTQQKVCVSV